MYENYYIFTYTILYKENTLKGAFLKTINITLNTEHTIYTVQSDMYNKALISDNNILTYSPFPFVAPSAVAAVVFVVHHQQGW